jgi:hypothetical protein
MLYKVRCVHVQLLMRSLNCTATTSRLLRHSAERDAVATSQYLDTLSFLPPDKLKQNFVDKSLQYIYCSTIMSRSLACYASVQ